jgi:hypothetical protein
MPLSKFLHRLLRVKSIYRIVLTIAIYWPNKYHSHLLIDSYVQIYLP